MNNRIGRYEIRGELGRGGFGQIFRAFDPQVGRMVAVKVLKAEGDQDLLTRFRNEAAATGKLRHKNIVTIFDFGEFESTAYIVMELLEGEDLQRAMPHRGSFSLLRKLDIVSQVAEGLHHAHEHGIIHRDIKPANIMLLPDGLVKIMDFGIASFAQAVTARLTPQGNMIGTFSYMSPEQFQGRTADKRSDIFAYGIVVYELLAGRHPFGPAEPPALMYNILYTSPPSLRELCPEAPARLEHIVLRALEKDPDLRYQSLDDIKFDVWPILLELKREHASGLLGEARQWAAAEQFDTAQRLIREILEVDSSNMDAQQLREQVHEELQRRLVRPRVQQLVQTSQQELDARRFQAAIQNLESALRLDQSNPEVNALLGRARQMQRQAQRADRMLADARQALEIRDLTAAHKCATQAREADPQNPELGALLDRISREIKSRDGANRLRDGLSRAKGKLLLEAFDEAIGILAELQQEHGDLPEIAEQQARASRDKAAREIKRQLDAEISAGKDAITRGALAEAIERLQVARARFPETAELADLLSYAETELRAQQRTETVQRILGETARLADTDQYDRAITLLQQGLASYPDDPQLSRVLDAAVSAKTRFERDKAFNETCTAAAELHEAASYQQALQRIDAFTATYGQDPDLIQLRGRIEAEWKSRQREDKVREALARFEDLIKSGKPAAAIQSLGLALEQAPNDPRLLSAMSLAQSKLREQQRADEIARIVNQADHLTATLLFDKAIEVLEHGLNAFPTDHALFQSHQAAMAAKSSHDRTQALEKSVKRITSLLEEKKFQLATDAVDVAVRELGDDPVFQKLRSRIQKECDAQQRAEALQAVRQLLDQGKPDQALTAAEKFRVQYPDVAEFKSLSGKAQSAAELNRLLEAVQQDLNRNAVEEANRQVQANKKMFAGDSRWDALCKETERRSEYSKALHRAEDYRRQGNFQKAEELLRQLSGQNPADANLRQILQRVINDRSAKERAQAIVQARQEANRLLAQGDAAAAIDRLDRACQDFPEDTGLLQARIEAQQNSETRQAELGEKVAARLQAIRQAISAGDWQRASEAVAAAQAEFSGDEAFAALAEQVRNGQYQADLQSFANRVRSKLDAKDFEETGRLLAAARPRFGQEALWTKFERDLQRRKSYETALQSAADLRRKNRHREAEDILRPLIGQDAVDERAAVLLQAIASERQARSREQAIQEAQKEVDSLKAKGDLNAALAVLEQLSRQYPDETSLLGTRVDLQNQLFEQQKTDRRARLAECLAKIREALASRQWAAAIAAIDEAQKDFPEDSALTQLREQARQGQFHEELEVLVRDTQQSLDRHDLDTAARLLNQSRSRYGKEKLWEALQKELTRHQVYEEALLKAEAYRTKEQYAKAAEILEKLAGQGPPDERAALLLRTVKTEREVQERAKLPRAPGRRKIPVWAWVAAAIVLVVVIWRLSTGRPPQPVFHFDPHPSELRFTYQPDSADSEVKEVVVGDPGAPFSVTTSESWLAVTQAGNRLLVSVKTAGLKSASLTGKITIQPKVSGTPPASPVVTVYLVVLDTTQVAQKPPPETLVVEPGRIDFPQYQIGGAVSEPKAVIIRQGSLASVSNPGAPWVNVEHNGNRIVATLRTAGIKPGDYNTVVKLRSREGTELGLPITASVIAAAPKQPESDAALRPAATPCIPADKWSGRVNGDTVWSGPLAAGAEIEVPVEGAPGRIISGGGKFPLVCVNVSSVDPVQVEVAQIPGTNHWRVKNKGEAVSGFKISWVAK